jgi:hypothetical protein
MSFAGSAQPGPCRPASHGSAPMPLSHMSYHRMSLSHYFWCWLVKPAVRPGVYAGMCGRHSTQRGQRGSRTQSCPLNRTKIMENFGYTEYFEYYSAQKSPVGYNGPRKFFAGWDESGLPVRTGRGMTRGVRGVGVGSGPRGGASSSLGWANQPHARRCSRTGGRKLTRPPGQPAPS